MRAVRRLGFQARVLIPVVTIMVLLLALTIWTVNRRFAEQVRLDAAFKLHTASSVFRHSQEMRKRNLLIRYRTVANEHVRV